MRDLWDLAWEDVAPSTFVAYNVDAASYTGAARKAQEWYDAMRAQGTGVLGIMETDSTASQGGYNVGMQFVQFARSRWAEVGFAASDPMAYAMSDGSAYDPNYGGENIAACGEGVGDYEAGPYLFYGNRYAVDAACGGAARSMHPQLCLNLNGGWIPRTWDFDPNRDTAAQEVGATPVAGTDVNTVYRPIFGAPAPPKPTAKKKGSDMDLVLTKGDGFWCKNGEFYVVGPGDTVQRVGVEADGTAQPFWQVIGDWGWLPSAPMPAIQVDKWITTAVQAATRKAKQDKQLASVTLP